MIKYQDGLSAWAFPWSCWCCCFDWINSNSLLGYILVLELYSCINATPGCAAKSLMTRCHLFLHLEGVHWKKQIQLLQSDHVLLGMQQKGIKHKLLFDRTPLELWKKYHDGVEMGLLYDLISHCSVSIRNAYRRTCLLKNNFFCF